MTDKKEKSPPEHWSELSLERRKALISQADDRIFWQGAFSRLGAFSKIAQMLLLVGAFVVALRAGLADWILGAEK